jgi:AcrR family transcriptional regulator
MAHVRMQPDARKQLILDAAIQIASGKGGIKKATRIAIADKAGVSVGLVSLYFGDRITLRAALVAEAVRVKHIRIIKEALELDLSVIAPRQLLRDAKAA